MKSISPRMFFLIGGVLTAIGLFVANEFLREIPVEEDSSPSLEGEGQFRFLRSLAIPAEGEGLDMEILNEVFDTLSSEETETKVVIDLDGLTNTGTPFVLYVNPRLDITAQVKSVYLDVSEKDVKKEESTERPFGESR